MTYIIDIALLLALAFFAWRGAKKGLILTLFSLLAVFVAFFGARAISAQFTQPVADILRPTIQHTIDGVLDGHSPGAGAVDPGSDSSPAPSADPAPVRPGTYDPAEDPQGDFTLQEVLDLIGESELFSGLREFLEEAVEEHTLEVTTTAAAAVAAYLARLAAAALLFGLSFLLILLVWFLVSRALDLAFRLPVLSAVNAVGGLLIGLLKGILVLLVVVWLARLAGVIDDASAGPVARLMTVEGLSRLLRSLLTG